MQEDKSTSPFLDWTQWVCPGPRRVFSAEEMTRAGAQPWPKGIDGYLLGNAGVLLALNANEIGRSLMPWMLLGTLVCLTLVLLVARSL